MFIKKLVLCFLGSFPLLACTSPTPSINTNMPLAGSEWGAGVKGQYIQFTAGGIVRGNGACNQFSGTFVQEGGGLKIGPLAATKMACVNLRQEQEFFHRLAQTNSAEISHLQLVLKDERGDTLLTLRRRDWD